MDRLGVDLEALARQVDAFLRRFGAAVGAPQSLTDARARRQQAYLRGIRMAKRLFCREAAA